MEADPFFGLILIGVGCLLAGLILGYAVGCSERPDPPKRSPSLADWAQEQEDGTWYGKL